MRVFFAGDFCSKPSTSRISLSNDLLSLLRSCDLRIVNFEVPLKPEISLPIQKRERFYQNDDAVGFLQNVGFNLFPLANNHLFDWGEDGFRKTKEAFGDDSFGSGTYDEAYNVKVVTVNGYRVGFLAVCFSAYRGVFDDVSKKDGLGCAYINDLKVNHVILDAKNKVDYLFVLPHNGIEYIDIPLPETIARYHDFIDYGADGVIGTHPHCPQGWETYKGKPIFYSLGNFLFNSKDGYDNRVMNLPHWYEGLCIVLTIDDGIVTCDVFNTKNVNNVEIVLDNNPDRESNNARNCYYLIDKQEYDNYLWTVCKDLGEKELAIVDKTVHSQHLGECTKSLVKLWIKRIKGKHNRGNDSLLRLLSHDSRRNLLMLALKMNQEVDSRTNKICK